jgi:hypothetical protein
VLDDSHELYKSADGLLVRYAELESFTRRLEDLLKALDNESKRIPTPSLRSPSDTADHIVAMLLTEHR